VTINLDFKVTGLSYALGILCAQLTRDLFVIADIVLKVHRAY